MAARQLCFTLPVRQALGREDFFVSEANAAAVGMIENWQGWTGSKLILTGPIGSGKTHLAHVWAGLADARIIAASDLSAADIPALATGNLSVENADRIAGDTAAENALFHLHNLALAEGHALLITARAAPRHWGLGLADLASRMQGTGLVAMQAPDDDLLAAIIMKLFADRQLSPTPETIPFMIRRMPRTFEAAHHAVTMLDKTAMQNRHAINRTLARKVLEGMFK